MIRGRSVLPVQAYAADTSPLMPTKRTKYSRPILPAQNDMNWRGAPTAASTIIFPLCVSQGLQTQLACLDFWGLRGQDHGVHGYQSLGVMPTGLCCRRSRGRCQRRRGEEENTAKETRGERSSKSRRPQAALLIWTVNEINKLVVLFFAERSKMIK